jgi:hypothetical protein
MTSAILSHINTLAHSLASGDFNHCLTVCGDTPSLDGLDTIDSDYTLSIVDALRTVAQRQVTLETENLRYRIAIQQQHQLLTCNSDTITHNNTGDATGRSNNNGGTLNRTPTPSLSLTQVATERPTSENDLLSVADSSLLERLQQVSSLGKKQTDLTALNVFVVFLLSTHRM